MDCGPGDHPREPHSRPKQRAQTRCSLAAAVRLRVASEEMSGAEVVHTFVATMRPDGGAATALRPPRAIASWSDASSVWQGRRLPRRRSAHPPLHKGAPACGRLTVGPGGVMECLRYPACRNRSVSCRNRSVCGADHVDARSLPSASWARAMRSAPNRRTKPIRRPIRMPANRSLSLPITPPATPA